MLASNISGSANDPAMLSRRSLLVGGGALALSPWIPRARAAGDDVLRVGYVSPRTGALAAFGETDPYILSLVRKSLASGIGIGGRTWRVEILDRDTQSDPARASQLTHALITGDAVDLVLTTAAPETVNPVADACEAAGVPCISTVMPWEAWYFGRGGKPGAPSPFKWTFHYGFGADGLTKTYLSSWNKLPTNRKLGVLYPNDADGNAVRRSIAPVLQQAGYTVVDPGPYEDGTTDFSAQIAVFKRERCELFNSFPLPPDFAAFWRQAAQRGYARMVKVAEVAKTGLLPSSVENLGSLGNGLSSSAYWHRVFPYSSPAGGGVTSEALAAGYEAVTGRQWTQQLGGSLGVFDLGLAALKNSGDPRSKAAVARACATLQADTIMGRAVFGSGPFPNVAIGPMINAQWVKAPAGSRFKLDYVTVDNATDPRVPVQAALRPFGA